MTTPLHSRLAPTPSGLLHVGNVFSFVLTWLWVRKTNGTLRLRIDDMDSKRVRPEYLEDIFQTLDWLELDWDSGPQTPDEFRRFHSQQTRMPLYEAFLECLTQQTEAVYACDCSRTHILHQASDSLYPGTCRTRNLPFATSQAAWRMCVPPDTSITFQTPQGVSVPVELAARMGDFIIRRKDGLPAYQLTSVADDVWYGINFIVRGQDLLLSTAAQVWMAQLLGEESFTNAVFYHHPLLTDATGSKLSKSAGAMAVRSLREHLGAVRARAQVVQSLAQALHLPPAPYGSVAELLEVFAFQLPDTFSFPSDAI